MTASPENAYQGHAFDGVGGKRVALVRELIEGADDEVVASVGGAIDAKASVDQLEHIAGLFPDEWLAASAVAGNATRTLPPDMRSRVTAEDSAQPFSREEWRAMGALVVLAFSQTRELFGSRSDILAACLPVSVAVTLIGLFVMVTRRQAILQVVGLMLLENAIFLAAVSLTYGMPLVVETGVLLDLMAGVAVLGLFVRRLEDALDEGDTTPLRELKG